jgi:hypothetical protein
LRLRKACWRSKKKWLHCWNNRAGAAHEHHRRASEIAFQTTGLSSDKTLLRLERLQFFVRCFCLAEALVIERCARKPRQNFPINLGIVANIDRQAFRIGNEALYVARDFMFSGDLF